MRKRHLFTYELRKWYIGDITAPGPILFSKPAPPEEFPVRHERCAYCFVTWKKRHAKGCPRRKP